MDEWEQFELGNYDGGYDDLSMGGESDVDNNLDWQDTLGTEGDLADQWLNSQGETEFNDPDSHLVGADTDQAILNARLRSTGLPITSENQIGNIPEYMRPSDVTVYNLTNLDPSQRNIDNLTLNNVMQGNISTLSAPAISIRQQRQFDKIVNATMKGGEQNLDALPSMMGHASDLNKDDFSIGGRTVDQVLYSLAGQYLKEGVSTRTQKNLAQQLAIQIPRTSRGMQASFGGAGVVSHLDALPTPMQLPSRFQGMLKPTLNVGGNVYDPNYQESRKYRFASQSDKDTMDWFNKPSGIVSLTGLPYQGMHKTQEQLAALDPMQITALEAQKDIEADFKGFLSLAGLAKDITGRKLSADNSQGTATNFIRPVVGADYFGTSNLDELARHGLMDEAGFIGEGGREGQMSSLGNYVDMITGGINPVDFNRPFTSAEIATAMGETVEERVAADKAAARVFNTGSTRNVVEDVTTELSGRALSQANVEAALKARGLNISNAEQGSVEWLAARTGTLTSTGIGTSMSESPYGDTWLGHIKTAINEKNNPTIAAQRSNPMFDAGTRGEELGKKWFEDKFNKNIVDLGLITDPDKPNQGTSVDGVVTGRDGTVGANLELTEFKWGTTRFPPRDAAAKHQQQLQHQMYMTGAGSVNLVTGYDPNAGTPRAGNEDEYIFANEPVFRDPDWAKNNADFIQARANEKASAVGANSVEGVKEGYLAALRERYPNESDKGLTKEERAEKKRLDSEARVEEREFKKEQREAAQNLNHSMSFLAKGAGGGINLQSTNDWLGGLGTIGKVASAVIGVGGAAYDAVRGTSDYVGQAADMGAESTGAMLASQVALKSLAFNDSQAKGFTEKVYSQQALASVGEFDPLVKRLTAYRGLMSMEDMTQLTPAQFTNKLQSYVESGEITKQQAAGFATLAGDSGVARAFASEDVRKDILAKEEVSRVKGLEAEGEIRATVSEMNVTAVNLNLPDTLKGELIKSFTGEGSEALSTAEDVMTFGVGGLITNAVKYMSDLFSDGVDGVAKDASTGNKATKLDSNIKVTVENKQVTTTLEQSVDGKEQPRISELTKDE